MADPMKQLIYESYLKFIHLNEQATEADLRKFLQQFTDNQSKFSPRNMTIVHVIDCIGRNEPINNVTIAKKMNLSKASITKISVKLIEDKLIRRFQLPDNKKEVYFKLTPLGRQVYEMHAILHTQKERQFHTLLERYSAQELGVILDFIRCLAMEIANEQVGLDDVAKNKAND